MMQAASENRPLPAAQADEAGAEQRTAARYTPLIRTAKLIGASGEFLCIVSDVSATGVSVRLFHPLPDDKTLCLEMPNGDQLPLETVWETEGRAGFRFACPVDLDRVVEGKGEWPKRPIRINLEMPVVLSGLNGRFEGTLRNISSQGAQIECRSRLAIEQRVRIKGQLLPEIESKVRWRHGTVYGLAFDSLVQFTDLARIAGLVQGMIEGRPNSAEGPRKAVLR